ncbi:hypothetical protein ACFQE8_02975 [Salinirubellus sp. GCM10025818]|uniref:hypothetical protein n=1 Tax=Salinirubellus TaxID=2162630 RepID=UPI0030CC13C6
MEEDETQPAMCYPSEVQYGEWKRRAESMDMSVSEFMMSMVEAGWKKFEATPTPDETRLELREQRNDLKAELERARDRVGMLEDRVHEGERSEIEAYVATNPGATYQEIVEHLGKTIPERASRHLDELEGHQLRSNPEGEYYPMDEQ